jgi:hypothetical protein
MLLEVPGMWLESIVANNILLKKRQMYWLVVGCTKKAHPSFPSPSNYGSFVIIILQFYVFLNALEFDMLGAKF